MFAAQGLLAYSARYVEDRHAASSMRRRSESASSALQVSLALP
jgi:hypothetical protein